MLARIDFQSMQSKVYEEIRSALMRGSFEPGQKVSTRGLAGMLGTSDMPVRAALGRLLAEGALVRNSNGTFAVPVISRRRFREVMEIRALLEGEATSRACGRVSDEGFARLRECSEGLDAAINHNDIEAYLEFNQGLKFSVYEFCPSNTLIAHIQLLWLQAGPFLRHLNKDLRKMVTANFHNDVIAGLQNRDCKSSGAAMSRDILAGMEFLLENGKFSDEKHESIE